MELDKLKRGNDLQRDIKNYNDRIAELQNIGDNITNETFKCEVGYTGKNSLRNSHQITPLLAKEAIEAQLKYYRTQIRGLQQQFDKL